MKPFKVLWYIPSAMQNIIGDENGNLGIATDEFLQACGDWCHSKALKVVRTDRGSDYLIPIKAPLTVALWEEDTPPPFVNVEVERVPIKTWVVADRWRVRCGYGPKTKTWVLRSPEPIDLLGETAARELSGC